MLWVYLLIFGCASAHVRLLYPPARFPAVDFIDNARTPPPCGVAKPRTASNDSRTFLKAGSQFEVEWFMSNVHKGGYRVELLDSRDQTIEFLTPSKGFVGTDNTTRTSVVVTLPSDLECFNCAIRLVREANEYGKNFVFYTCADVNILNDVPEGNTCLGRGQRTNGTCECDKFYSGKSCSREDECATDDDCGEGTCIEFSKEADPRRQCFCKLGYYGERCDKQSPTFSKDADFDASLYHMREVGADQDKIFWRIIQDEIEVVLKYSGKSWAALGWKPQDLDGKCPTVSNYATSGDVEEEKGVVVVAPISAESGESVNHLPSLPIRPIPKKNETVCGENEVLTKCPEPSRKCEPSCDWTKFPETVPDCEKTCAEPRCVCQEGFVRISNDDSKCVPFSYCQDEVEVECPSNSTWAKCGTACEPTCENMYDTSPCPAKCENPACTCADNYVRRNGACIYWGDCPNLDQHWTTDNSTENKAELTSAAAESTATTVASPVSVDLPIHTLAPSMENLTCAVNETINECGRVCEPDCVTIFIRDQCTQCAEAACACIQGYARNNGKCVYWGDCPLDVKSIHSSSVLPTTANNATDAPDAEKTTPARANAVKSAPYFSSDKIHTDSSLEHNEKPKGDHVVVGDVCYGDWRWPEGCRDCDYRVSWNYVDDTDEIEFSIETRLPTNWWTGIGFSSTGTMQEADMIVVKSKNGELTLHDMYSNTHGIPKEDYEQNVYTPTVVGTHVNGVLRAQFTRKRDTGDKKADHRFSDANCYKFLFPVSGGRLDSAGKMQKHISTPLVSENKVCIRSCLAPQHVQPTSTCETEFRHPTGCSGTACDYVAKWQYNATKKDVRFEISSKEIGRWTGIGFSRDGQMANSDIYTGWVYDGKAYVTDRFAYGRQLPAIDPADRQDIYDIGGRVEDEIQTIWFRRKVLPADTVTDFPLNKCYYFLFPIGGGRVLARKSQDFQNVKAPIGYHDLYQPRVSRTKICICDENGVSIATEEVAPVGIRRRRQVADPFEVQIDPFVGIPSLRDSKTSKEQNENDSSTAEPEPEPKSEDPVAEPEPEPEPEPEASSEKNDESKHKDHAMDCTDIVIGSVVDGFHQVRDYYTISRATPRLDEYYGGKFSLTGAAAYEQDGQTTVVFRRKLQSSDKADHSIVPSPMTVIWAKGNIENDFFKKDIIRYHGKHNRGSLTLNFHDALNNETPKRPAEQPEDCLGSFAYPPKCSSSECTYRVRWVSDGKNVHFHLDASINVDMWTSVGFSNDGGMANADVIAVAVQKDGTVAVTDQFSPGYGRPTIDKDQGVFNVEAIYHNGRLTANFSRSLASKDENDVSLEECQYFVYTHTGGDLEGGSGDIRKHKATPLVSSKPICLSECKPTDQAMVMMKKPVVTAPDVEPTVVAEDVPPPKQKVELFNTEYYMTIRILNREFTNDLMSAETDQYQVLQNELKDTLNPILNAKIPGVVVKEVKEFRKGSVLAYIALGTNNDEPPTAKAVNSIVEEAASRGPIGTFRVEPTTIKTMQLEQEQVVPALNQFIIIGACGGVFLIALSLLICFLCVSRRSKRNEFLVAQHHQTLTLQNGAYATPYMTPGYAFAQAPQAEKMKRKRDSTGEEEVAPPNEKGFDNQGFNGNHARQFSQATTASQNGKGSPKDVSGVAKGVGETTYQEWYSKVASKDAPGHLQESTYQTTSRAPSRGGYQGATPYVTYPNDMSAYYTLNGEHRMNRPPTSAAHPPGYYRQF